MRNNQNNQRESKHVRVCMRVYDSMRECRLFPQMEDSVCWNSHYFFEINDFKSFNPIGQISTKSFQIWAYRIGNIPQILKMPTLISIHASLVPELQFESECSPLWSQISDLSGGGWVARDGFPRKKWSKLDQIDQNLSLSCRKFSTDYRKCALQNVSKCDSI